MLYSITPVIQYTPLYHGMRFCLKVHFSDKKEKKGPLSGIELRTADTRDARDATTAIGSVFFTPAATSTPLLRSCSHYKYVI